MYPLGGVKAWKSSSSTSSFLRKKVRKSKSTKPKAIQVGKVHSRQV